MRKISVLILTNILIVCLFCASLTACSNGGTGSHKHEYTDVQVIAPTCVENGFTRAYCKCGKYIDKDITDALGHNLIHHDQKTASCTAAGHKEYDNCTRCDYTTYKEIPKLGHTTVIDKEGTPATCTSAGIDSRSHCSTCGITLTSGEVLPAMGHNFDNDSLRCLNCNEALNPEFKPISTVTELQNINLDLNGKYYLTQSLSLYGYSWSPIGAGHGKFTGVFDGNYCGVSDLSLSSASANVTGGLFETNAGTIKNCTILNFTASAVFNETTDNTFADECGTTYATYGAFAGRNEGAIDNCTVYGSVNMATGRTLKKYITWAKDAKDHSDETYACFGGIAGVNNGTIQNCTNSSTFVCNAAGWTESKQGFLGGINQGTWRVILTGSAGGIVGINGQGASVINCNASGTFTFNSSMTANCVSNNGVVGWACQVQNSMRVGTLAGSNLGSLSSCKSRNLTINRFHNCLGYAEKTYIGDLIVSNAPNGFYGINEGGTVLPIEQL